jgi:cyclopropane-fatty-acyl-phospholipid synthase
VCAGLLVTDIEILRLHYAETLKAWRERFLAHREEVERLYDARFTRIWEFYLAASEMAFREQAMMVFQPQARCPPTSSILAQGDPTAWLRWSDSNPEMSAQNIPLKDRTDFQESSQILAGETIRV